jgi:ribosomal protein L12E/L44/L45/RPP1/RPP2
MSKKVEIKRKWEDNLKEYKDPILYARSVLIWKRPIDFGVFLSLISLALWFLCTTEMTVVTLASLCVVGWAVLSWLVVVTSFRFPWSSLVPQSQEASSNVDHFGDVIGFFVQVRFALVDTLEDMQRFRAANPTRFVLQITGSGLILAYIGTLISGQFLLVAFIYAVLLLPGAVANGVPERVAAVAEPHVKVYREKITAILTNIMQQVDQQIKKTKHTPSGASASTPAAASTPAPQDSAAPAEDAKKDN